MRATSLNQKQRPYSFPILKMSEIFACLGGLQLPSEEDIRRCDPTAIRQVFEFFIESIMGVTKEEMNQPVISGLSELDYPELHQDSIPLMSFFRNANKLMCACGVYDFCLNDILTPTPKRLRKHLSALVNFTKYREEELARVADVDRDIEDAWKEKARLDEENEMLERQLNELLNQQRAEQPAIDQINNECAELEKQIHVLNNQQAIVRRDTNELKKKTNQLREEIAAQDFKIQEADKCIEKLQMRLVNSPERVKKEMSEMTTSLDTAKAEYDALQKTLRDLQEREDIYARAVKDGTKLLEFMAGIEQDIQRCKDAKELVKNQKKQLEENHRRENELANQRKRTENMLAQKRELLESFRREATIKIQAADQALDAAQQELQQRDEESSEIQKLIDANKKVITEINAEMNAAEHEYQKELQEIEQMKQQLERTIQHYNNQLLCVIHTSSQQP